jgi:tripartite ATP-independent transporter DctM subunit
LDIAWYIALLIILGGVVLLMFTGMPVAFAFFLIGTLGAFLLFGGEVGLHLIAGCIRDSLSRFVLIPIVLFILMGEVMFHSGIAPNLINAVDKWIGRLPGRLSLEAVVGGTIFSTLTGTSLAATALLGELLVPEMERQGYKKPMSLGPILGSGGLAMMIPPSGLAVLLGALAWISIGRILIGIIIPGLLMAALYATYIILRSRLQPHLAPPYTVPPVPLSDKLISTVKYILPVSIIIFMVTGFILLGIATPSEAAATGSLGTFLLVAAYRKLNWQVTKKAIIGTLNVSIMILFIIASAQLFTQTLAMSGGTQGAIHALLSLPLSPLMVIIIMQVIVFIMGMFLSVVPIMLITIPIYMPIVGVLGFDPVWFCIIYLLNIEMGTTSPPFGLALFVMKGVAPKGTTMGDVYRSAYPFLGCDLIVMILLIAFPAIALWLPGLMRG